MKQDEYMKAPESTERANLDADSEELNGSGRDEESTDQGIRTAHTPKANNILVSVCALTVNPHGCVSWAKTIQVIYSEEPMNQHQEEDDSKECKSCQEEGSRRR